MDEAPSLKLPANLLFVAEQLSGYNRNRFRIEPTSATEATAGRIITINLPENALIDMNSIRFHFDADAGFKGNTVGLLPEFADAFISNLEVYINGIQVQQSSQDYNMIAHTLRLGGWNQDCQQSKGRLVNHAQIYGDKALAGPFGDVSGVGEIASLVIDQWAGFLNQVYISITRFSVTVEGEISLVRVAYEL